MKESTKQLLKTSLSNDDFDKFMEIIENLDVNKENYEELLESINAIIIDKMLQTNINGVKNSEKRLLKAFSNDEEHSFLDYVMKLRSDIVGIFQRKLKQYTDADVSANLENFKSRFM